MPKTFSIASDHFANRIFSIRNLLLLRRVIFISSILQAPFVSFSASADDRGAAMCIDPRESVSSSLQSLVPAQIESLQSMVAEPGLPKPKDCRKVEVDFRRAPIGLECRDRGGLLQRVFQKRFEEAWLTSYSDTHLVWSDIHKPATWEAANRICSSSGGRLPSVYEISGVAARFPRFDFFPKATHYWTSIAPQTLFMFNEEQKRDPDFDHRPAPRPNRYMTWTYYVSHSEDSKEPPSLGKFSSETEEAESDFGPPRNFSFRCVLGSSPRHELSLGYSTKDLDPAFIDTYLKWKNAESKLPKPQDQDGPIHRGVGSGFGGGAIGAKYPVPQDGESNPGAYTIQDGTAIPLVGAHVTLPGSGAYTLQGGQVVPLSGGTN